jgi:hypothetical protein
VILKRGKTMGSLYTFPRRLFWRRWQPKWSKLSQHFFFDLVRELSGLSRVILLCSIRRWRWCHHLLYSLF